ncbi:transmembrane emp24 domain-containing protein 1a isoform X1 [Hypomesus transpacificus]|uniref:transmembrane emp24 domain-containing protein 1a isoform X1 n=1 Tax=Hypomesus transpacificus TaxID=137520 RepID=UPI001F07CB2E|nr:transmembrane emp24 domain-containing protein 1a isoform X1 [Hypomesus transpacificus]
MTCRTVSGVTLGLLLTYFLANLDFTLCSGQNQDTEFTFLLPAGTTECFFQTTVQNGSLEVEYQVIAGAGLDVGFTLISPSGYRLASDFRRSDGIHTVEPTEDGDYRLCFDNSFSKLSEKMVFFEVILEGQAGAADRGDSWVEMDQTESLVEFKLEYMRETTESVHRHLEKSRQVQSMLRAFEARDRYLLEDNLWRVSFWSCLNLLVILTVALTQVCTLRRLFDHKRTVRT